MNKKINETTIEIDVTPQPFKRRIDIKQRLQDKERAIIDRDKEIARWDGRIAIIDSDLSLGEELDVTADSISTFEATKIK